MWDSIFSLYTQSDYDGDRPEIPTEKIIADMEAIESATTRRFLGAIDNAVDELMARAEPALRTQNLAAIAQLTWNLRVVLQEPLFREWQSGWYLGEEHGIEEMGASIPKEYAVFAIGDDIRAAISLTPEGIDNSEAEKAIQSRVIRLVGNFGDDLLVLLKADLIAAVQPQPGTGEPISRRELLGRIQNNLNVTEARAEAIARTELTNAYNQGRMASYNQSDLVEYVRFMAIRDDRTTEICKSRQGLIFPKGSDAATNNTPPLHVRCRSVLSPLMPRINPRHRAMVEDPGRQLENRRVAPLGKGWNKTVSP